MTDPVTSTSAAEAPLRTVGIGQSLKRLWDRLGANSRLLRWTLGGPVTLIVTLAIMAGMTVWWPAGGAGIDQVAMPIILFPVIWVCVFVYAVLEDHLGRGCLVMVALIIANAALLVTA